VTSALAHTILQWAEACEFLDSGNVITVRGFWRAADPSNESQQTMTSKFDFVLRADTADGAGPVPRSLKCDNCGWVVELGDDNVKTCRIDVKAWKRKVKDEVNRRKAIVHYHKLADIVEAWCVVAVKCFYLKSGNGSLDNSYAPAALPDLARTGACFRFLLHLSPPLLLATISFPSPRRRKQHAGTIISAPVASSGSATAAAAAAGGSGGGDGAGASSSSPPLSCKSVNFYGVIVDYTHPRQTNGLKP